MRRTASTMQAFRPHTTTALSSTVLVASSSSASSLSLFSRRFYSVQSSSLAPYYQLPSARVPNRRTRFHYAKIEDTATYQAARRANGADVASGRAESLGAEVPVSPIDRERTDVRAMSSSSAVEVPEGSVVYSGPSSTTAVPIPHHLFNSVALRDSASSKRKNISISPQKLNDICRMVRGLSVQEAMIQLKLSHKKKAHFIRSTIGNAAGRAVNVFNMEKSRLYVSKLWVGRATHLKRVDIKGRGRSGMKRRYRSHLFCEVSEQGKDSSRYKGIWKHGGNSHDPRTGEEVRIGRAGRKISTLERTLAAMKEWRVSRGMAPRPDGPTQKFDAKKAFRAAGVATDLEAVFGAAAVAAAKKAGAQ